MKPSHSSLATTPEDQTKLNDLAKEATALCKSGWEGWRVHSESTAKIKDGMGSESVREVREGMETSLALEDSVFGQKRVRGLIISA